jgi:hypothetical protein
MTYRALFLAAALALPACTSCNAPPVKERLKTEGDSCEKDINCDTGLCFALAGQAQKCGRKCSAGCTAEEVCTQIDLQRFGCVPKREGLCKTCATDSDCPYPADRCIVVGTAKVCGRDCSFDNACPESYHCTTAHDSNGTEIAAQCEPKSGTCECTAISVGQRLTCQQGNDAGTCTGTRTCEAAGYGPCTAKQPGVEVCNGQDDNCNTQVDEDLGETTCGKGECKRTVSNCVNGMPQTCVEGTGSPEICDEKDNDCDGTVDDGINKNSVTYCGSCTNSCSVANGVAKCTTGTCGVDSCTAPYKDCDGVYGNGCEANTDTSLLHCGGCAKPCTAANATPTCSTGTCTFVCLPGYGDLDKVASNGCEALCTATDTPELGFVDANCDGIDGDLSKAIFVDTVSGNDSSAGTKAAPKKTISSGLSAAAAANPKKEVYVSKGVYSEAVTLANGVSLYGGYDASNGWSRSNSNTTILLSPSAVGFAGLGLNAPMTVQLFSINATSASGTAAGGEGNSSYGALILNSTGPILLSALTVNPGNGSAGLAGSAGSTGSAAGGGGNAFNTSRGDRGYSPCGAHGGYGGDGVGSVGGGNMGDPGTQVFNGGAAGPGGNPGASGSCSAGSSGNGGDAPPLTVGGSQGNGGLGGQANINIGVLNAGTLYLPPSGFIGLTGYPGGGGGGGGAGGGTANGTPTFCTDCAALWSGGGGGGGGGGCGGVGGSGGRGGGGSFGFGIISSVVTIESTKVTTGNGGKGGDGGNGGGGGSPGGPGGGVVGASRSTYCSTRQAGRGADGAWGGWGGTGGGGSGGTGGPSMCVFYKGTAPTTNNLQCFTGQVGLGGLGGWGVVRAPSGPAGVSGTVVASN